MSVDEAYDLISTAIDAGRTANGYLIIGDVFGAAAELVDRLLAKLYPDAPEQIEKRIHPDVHIVEPAGKSRQIKVDPVRDEIVAPMAVTSYCGGWKTGIIGSVDRMNEDSANTILKTLEEPPPRTLFLLTSDQPDLILPTVISRCQRVDLPPPENRLGDDNLDEVARILREAGEGVYARSVAAAELTAVFKELKEGVEDNEAAVIRKDFYRALLEEARRWMSAGRLPWHQAFRNVDAIEEAYAQSCKNMSDEPVLAFLMDRLSIPPK